MGKIRLYHCWTQKASRSGGANELRIVMTQELVTFSIRDTPLLKSGSTMKLVTRAPGLWMHLKVYADGGENGLHTHPNEDHMFFVLQGEATFVDFNGRQRIVGANEGVTVPRGVAYAFRASGDQNLVLLRVGSSTDLALTADSAEYPGVPKATLIRKHVDGVDFSASSEENKTGSVPGVPSGETFAAAP
jgi:mannose-6-phosphate isomerase-like protein (cupin superfamily)